MNKAGRNIDPTEISCEDEIHTFSLAPLTHSNKEGDKIMINFSPLSDSKGKIAGVIPKFNRDCSFLTPAFLLGIEKTLYDYNASNSTDQFRQKFDMLTNETLQILQPKPSKSYCHICKQNFDDYIKVTKKSIQHIEHKIHRKNLKNTPFNNQIDSLIVNFQKKKLMKSEKKSEKRFFSSVGDNGEGSSEDKSRKRRIVENNLYLTPVAVKLTKQTLESTQCLVNKIEVGKISTF